MGPELVRKTELPSLGRAVFGKDEKPVISNDARRESIVTLSPQRVCAVRRFPTRGWDEPYSLVCRVKQIWGEPSLKGPRLLFPFPGERFDRTQLHGIPRAD